MEESTRQFESTKSATSQREESISGAVRDGRLYETIYDESAAQPLQFIVREVDGTLKRQPSIVVNGKAIYPPTSQLDTIRRQTVLLPSDVSDYGTPSELLWEIKAFIHRYADLPAFEEEMLAHYVLMTWRFDQFSAVPYLRFIGEPGTGKTRLLKIIHQLSNRGIFFGAGSSVPPLFRFQDQFHGTIIFDEADFSKSDMQSDIVKILNGGYSKGTPVMRSGSGDSNFAPQAFDVYGPKVIANRSRFSDAALETRCLTFQTTEKPVRPDVPKQLPNVFFEEGAMLRSKLLKWRLTEYHSIVINESAFDGLSGRQAEIGTPIYSISPDDGFKERFLRYMTEHDAELRSENPSLLVLDVLAAFSDSGHEAVLSKDATERVQRLARKREASSYGIHPRRVNELALSLGFRKKKTNAGQSILLDTETLRGLRQRYGREMLPADVLELFSEARATPVAA
jgi:hypothetical protein